MIHQKMTADQLRIGMCVELPPGALRNQEHRIEMVISSESELEEVRRTNLSAFLVKEIDDRFDRFYMNRFSKEEETPNAVTDSSEELEELINDPTLPPERKAQLVHDSAMRVAESIFSSPHAACIKTAKHALGGVVNLIFSDRETALNMLKITTYDPDTYQHSVRVGVLAISFTKSLFSEELPHNVEDLGAGFFLHDIGKTVIPSEILHKPGKLDERELAIMKTHPDEGYKLLQRQKQLTHDFGVIVRQHHERADGKGYPDGLTSGQIHIYGKICALADVFDALTTERPYKKAMTTYEALGIMKNKMKGAFDEELFAEFIRLFDFSKI
ncbi:MAG: HD domain-containing protein [bacterium]|nr:HD domain-containing protein [bacterium]